MYVTTRLKHCSEWVGKCHTVARVCNIVDTDDHRHQHCVPAAYKNNVRPWSQQHTDKISNQFHSHHILTTHFNNILIIKDQDQEVNITVSY